MIHTYLDLFIFFFFSSRRRHTRLQGDWSSDVCSSDLIVLIDRQQPWGNNERLLPRGTLREPPSHLARASTIFITKSDGRTEDLRQRISGLNPGAGIIECIHHPLYLEDVFTGQRLGLDYLKGRKVAS